MVCFGHTRFIHIWGGNAVCVCFYVCVCALACSIHVIELFLFTTESVVIFPKIIVFITLWESLERCAHTVVMPSVLTLAVVLLFICTLYEFYSHTS